MCETTQPLVSVIVPVYNTAEFLEDCLNSLSGQTADCFEVVCVDDGSTDGCADILDRYAGNHPNFRVIHQANSGSSNARNVGIRNAEGRFIAFVDSDDYLLENTIEVLASQLENVDPDILIFGGKSFPEPNWADECLSPTDSDDLGDKFDVLFNYKAARPFAWNKIYRKKMLEDNDILFPEDIELGEDQVFEFMVFPKADKIAANSGKFYQYRTTRPGSTMSKYQDREHRLRAHFMLVERVLDVLDGYGALAENGTETADWMLGFLGRDIAGTYNDIALKMREDFLSLYDCCGASTLPDDGTEYLLESIRAISEDAPEPVVSVIMPTCDSAEYIESMVDQVICQPMRDFEFIIVDDGSQDRTLEVLQRISKRDPRIIVVSQEHLNAGAARNNGLARARGEFVYCIDDNCALRPWLLSDSLKKIRKTNADICVMNADGYDQNVEILGCYGRALRPDLCPKTDVFSVEDNPDNIFCFTSIAPWNKLYRRDFVQRNNLSYQSVGDDSGMLFTLTALASAERITMVDYIIITHMPNHQKPSRESQEFTFPAFAEALVATQDELKRRGLYEKVKRPFKNHAVDCCLRNLERLEWEQDKDMYVTAWMEIRKRLIPELGLADIEEGDLYSYSSDNFAKFSEIMTSDSIVDYIQKKKIFPDPDWVDACDQLDKANKNIEALHVELADLEAKRDALQAQYDAVLGSTSWRLGSALTSPARKIKDSRHS